MAAGAHHARERRVLGIHLVVLRGLARRGGLGGRHLRLARLRLPLACAALLLLLARLGDPRRRRVHLVSGEHLAERLALQLLMEQSLPSSRVQLVAHCILLGILSRRLLHLLAARDRLRLRRHLSLLPEGCHPELGADAVRLLHRRRHLAAGLRHVHRDVAHVGAAAKETTRTRVAARGSPVDTHLKLARRMPACPHGRICLTRGRRGLARGLHSTVELRWLNTRNPELAQALR